MVGVGGKGMGIGCVGGAIKANSMNVFITLGKLLLQEVGDDSILI